MGRDSGTGKGTVVAAESRRRDRNVPHGAPTYNLPVRGRRLLLLGASLVLAGALVGAPPRAVLADDADVPRLRRAKPIWTTALSDSVAAVLSSERVTGFGVVLKSGSIVRIDEDGEVLGEAADLGIGGVVEAIPGGPEDAWSLRGTAGTAFVRLDADGAWSVRATTRGAPPDGAYLGIDSTRSVFVGQDGGLRYVWDRDGERADVTRGAPPRGAARAALYDPRSDAILIALGDGVVATRLADGKHLAGWDAGGSVARLAVEPSSGALLAGRIDGVVVLVRRGASSMTDTAATEVTELPPPAREAIDPTDWDGGPVVACALDPRSGLVAVARGDRVPPAVLVHDGKTGRILFRCVPPEGATARDVALGWGAETLLVGWGPHALAFRFEARAGEEFARGSPASPRPEMLSTGIEALLRPAGAEGTPVHVAAGRRAWATTWSDGSVSIREEGRAPRRVPPPGDGETFRRAAVTGAGVVVALTSRGRLLELAAAGPRPIPVTGVQSSARLAPDSHVPGDLWVGGESGALFRLDVRGGTLETVSGDGQAPITALASEPRGVLVGRADGTVVRHKPKGDTPPLLSVEGGIVALASGLSWDAALASDGFVHAFWSPVVKVGVEGRIVAVGARDEDLAVFHEPCCVTLFSMRDRPPVATDARFLDGRVRAACAIVDSGGGFLVATDAGERIVRFGGR